MKWLKRHTIEIAVLVLMVAILLWISDSTGQTIDQEYDPCYQGPPSSAPQCGKVPRDAKPVKGKPYPAGDAGNPVQCVEDQLTWTDARGCTRYCRLSTHCGAT